MKNLQLIKSERFGPVEADIYSNDSDMFMTISQLAACLEYADKKGVENLIDRNTYLRNSEFSYIQKVPLKSGGTQSTRTFTEDGIYEVTMLSGQPKAKEFRAWIRKVLKALRRGDVKLTPARRSLGETNAAARIISQVMKEAGMPPEYRAVAIKSLYAPAGVEIPLDGITTDKQLFDCTTIAKKIGLFSASGNPHNKAVSAIVSQLQIGEDEKSLVPFQNAASGHSGPTWQYTQSVLDKVYSYLENAGFPPEIQSKGKLYKVRYKKNLV